MLAQIIYNPHSGGFSTARLERLQRAFLDNNAITELSATNPADGIKINSAANLICVFGGDGTVRDVVNAMCAAASDIPLCIYPIGTINLVAREMGHGKGPDAFVASVLRTQPGAAYAITTSAGICVACASAGPDSRVVANLSVSLKRRLGRLAYVWSFLKLLVTWPRQIITLDIDGSVLDCESFYVLNGRYYAGRWSPVPEASLRRNTFFVVAMVRARRRDMLALMLNLVRHRPVKSLSNIVVREGRNLSAWSATSVPLQIDGDTASNLPVSFSISETSLRYL